MDEVCRRWSQWLSEHPQVKTLKGQRVYAGDGIKVCKEGRRMPGVKGLHQESADVSKPEWIRGQYFSALSLLLGTGKALQRPLRSSCMMALKQDVSPLYFSLNCSQQKRRPQKSWKTCLLPLKMKLSFQQKLRTA